MSAPSTVVVTKLAAATRLLEAAIRMFLREDDTLAVHVVSSAVFRVLTDVAESRGHDTLEDGLSLGLFYLGRDYLDGSMPDWARDDPDISPLAREVGEAIRAGKITGPGEVALKISDTERRLFWTKFNASYNFLKHSQRDIQNVLDEDALNTAHTLLAACRLFEVLFPDQINNAVFCYMFFQVWKDKIIPGPLWMQRLADQASRMDEVEVRKFLLSICEGGSAITS